MSRRDRGKTPVDSAESTAPTLAGPKGSSAASTASGRSSPAIDMHGDTAIGEEDSAPSEAVITDEASASDTLGNQTLRGRYEILAKLGQGGMGAVYEARDKNLGGKRVAVKVLLDKYSQKDTVVARLEQEARLASAIGHPNIINITDFGNTVDGRTFVVMEYLDGESLAACLDREGALTPYRAVKIARQCASALGAAHKKDIIHRDIKPENVFLEHRGDDDFVKVVDFGISKSVRPESGTDSPRLTQTGMVLGTPLYMSPEQARGDEALDHRIDVYALGIILYEMVTGDVPFHGTNYLNILTQVVSDEPPAPSERKPGIPRDLEAVILKAMEKNASERYQTMEELDADLAEIQHASSGMISTAARITASRRRGRRRKSAVPKIVVWVGGLLVVIGAVFATIRVLMRDDAGGKDDPDEAAVAATLDASVAAPPAVIDAAPAKPDPGEPAAEILTLKIKTSAAGASVYWGDTLVCEPTPCDWSIPKKDQEYTLSAERGELYGEIRLNPITHKTGDVVSVRLKKADKSTPKRAPRRPGAGGRPDKPASGDDKSGGDLTGKDFIKGKAGKSN